MEQLEFTVKSKCDKCYQFKDRPFSYFTDRMWYCDECKIKIIKSLKCKNINIDKCRTMWLKIYTACNKASKT